MRAHAAVDNREKDEFAHLMIAGRRPTVLDVASRQARAATRRWYLVNPFRILVVLAFLLALVGCSEPKKEPPRPCYVANRGQGLQVECSPGFKCRGEASSTSLVVLCLIDEEADASVAVPAGVHL